MGDDDTKNTDIQFQRDPYEDEEAEEALSLCDLPLDSEIQELHDLSSKFLNARRSSSEFFEFFSDHSSDSFMCSAERHHRLWEAHTLQREYKNYSSPKA
ncbi:hypothetical protein M0R45_019014 [Rubus argutus]|uniref:Uncharacterized protein n=1 Tax=Rubus argutus TaxID=59490 RepID=A0AAW1X636_RUBAR